MVCQSIPRPEPVYTLRAPQMKGKLCHFEEAHSRLPKFSDINLSHSLPPKGTFYQGHCVLGKENNQTFWRLLNTGSEMTWIPGDPKCPCSSEVRVGDYGGQVINGVLAQSHLTVDPMVTKPILWLFPLSKIPN